MEVNYIIWGAGLKVIFILCLLIKKIALELCKMITQVNNSSV